MIKDVIIKELTKYSDQRGWLAEIFREDESDLKPVMSYISVTLKNVSRGPHEHLKQSDFFVFVGPGTFMVYLWDNRKDSPTYEEKMEIEVGEDKPTTIIVPPGVVHGYKCISETPAWSINLPDKLYKGTNKTEEVDEVRWEQIEGSPFKIE
jgi:dTDP-4-dehydrorhamnose 3,5-epimerase